MQIDMNFTKYRELRDRADYLDRLLARMQRIDGVTAVGAGGSIPFLERAGGAQDPCSIARHDGRARPRRMSPTAREPR